jgi:hypothetical protein
MEKVLSISSFRIKRFFRSFFQFILSIKTFFSYRQLFVLGFVCTQGGKRLRRLLAVIIDREKKSREE